MSKRRVTVGRIAWGVAILILAGCAPESQRGATPAGPAGAEAAAQQAPTNQPLSNKVVLGSPELTAGIPGKGPLTLNQIDAWLARPENHEVLEVELPLGLNAGRIPDGVLQSNPLTRAKIELGRQLYFDNRISADNSLSCATCHNPIEAFGRHTQFGVGIRGQTGNRNSPVSYNRILSLAQFWDGRAGSLEDQAVGPMANPIEMGNTHEQVVSTIKKVEGYRRQFDRIFGENSLTIENAGKAIAAFERVLVTGPSPFDYYERLRPLLKLTDDDFADDPDLKQEYETKLAESRAHPMSESAIRGRDLFFSQRVNCAHCHVGANLTDELYHNLGVGMDKPDPDPGRYNVTKIEKDKGAFKTPTIRNVALSAPYMHDGSQQTLLEVVEHYNKGGTPNQWLSPKIQKLNLTDQEKQDLVAFMEACTGAFPPVETARLPE
ncbi:MAG: cytochrome-c peroxidase [Planctomycetaceae bacterium]